MKLIGNEFSSFLNTSIFVDIKNEKESEEISNNVVKQLNSVDDKISKFVENYTDQIPRLILFKKKLTNDPYVQFDITRMKPVVNVNDDFPYITRKVVANVLTIYMFMKNYFKYSLSQTQISVISNAISDLLVSVKVKPVPDKILKETIFPEVLTYVCYMFFQDRINSDIISRFYSQTYNLSSEKVKLIKKLIGEYKDNNITTSDKLFKRIQPYVGLENLSQRILMKFEMLPDIIFLFDQPFYLYTTFTLSMQWKQSPTFSQTIENTTGKKIFNYIVSLNR